MKHKRTLGELLDIKHKRVLKEEPAPAPIPASVSLGLYQHFKGGRYLVLAILIEPESGERLVYYRDVEAPNKQWLRPVEAFMEQINGQPRFTLLENRKPRYASRNGKTVVAVHTENGKKYLVHRHIGYKDFHFRIVGIQE